MVGSTNGGREPTFYGRARDHKGVVMGFYCAFDPSRFPGRFHREDPVTLAWMEHLEQQPLGREQRALFLRRWLAADTGEAPSAVQAACFVDLKRKYLELRPNLRRVYLYCSKLGAVCRGAANVGLSGPSRQEGSAQHDRLFYGNVGFRAIVRRRLARSPRGCGIRRRREWVSRLCGA